MGRTSEFSCSGATGNAATRPTLHATAAPAPAPATEHDEPTKCHGDVIPEPKPRSSFPAIVLQPTNRAHDVPRPSDTCSRIPQCRQSWQPDKHEHGGRLAPWRKWDRPGERVSWRPRTWPREERFRGSISEAWLRWECRVESS
jgi:hypothetical protein